MSDRSIYLNSNHKKKDVVISYFLFKKYISQSTNLKLWWGLVECISPPQFIFNLSLPIFFNLVNVFFAVETCLWWRNVKDLEGCLRICFFFWFRGFHGKSTRLSYHSSRLRTTSYAGPSCEGLKKLTIDFFNYNVIIYCSIQEIDPIKWYLFMLIIDVLLSRFSFSYCVK